MTRRRGSPDSRPGRRRAAKLAGQATYDPGTPCRLGHPAGRYTSSDTCIECDRLAKLRGTPDEPPTPLGHLLADWTPVLIHWERRA